MKTVSIQDANLHKQIKLIAVQHDKKLKDVLAEAKALYVEKYSTVDKKQ